MSDMHVTHLGIQCPLQLQHVRVLFWVDVVIWEINQQPFYVQPTRKI